MDYNHTSRLTIREWSVSDRPREKYMVGGAQNLSDAELIAILLRTGTQKESAVDVAKRLLAANSNSLNAVSSLTMSELTQIAGIGKVKAITLRAAFELGRRRRAEVIEEQKSIGSMEDVVEVMQSRMAETTHEEFWVIYVNQASVILNIERIGAGGLTATTVDVRLIIRKAIEALATGIFLCHNHPSGNLKPSQQDIKLTHQICKAADLFNIKVLDHVIVCKNQGFSFYAEGML